MNPKLLALREEDAKIRAAKARIESEINGEETAEQTAELDALHARADQIAEEAAPLVAREDSITRAGAVLARFNGETNAVVRADAPADMSVGDYFAALYRAQTGHQDAREALVRAGHFRTVQDQVTADFEVGDHYTGEILKLADSTRPVFDSLASKPFIPAMTVSRGVVTQRTLIAEQAAQKDELASRQFQVDLVNSATRTFGGTLDVARQYLDLMPANAFDELLKDFADTYNEVTEGAAVIFLGSLASGASSSWSASSISSIVTSVTNGMQAVYATGKKLPNTLWLSLDETFEITSKFNTDDSVSALERLRRSLEAAGLSLNIVTGPQLPTNTRILGVGGQAWVRERRNGLVSAPAVSLHGVDIAYSGYVNFDGNEEFFLKLV